MKKRKQITEEEFAQLVFEAGKLSNDPTGFAPKLEELEALYGLNPHLKPAPGLLTLKGNLLTNQGRLKEANSLYQESCRLAVAQNKPYEEGVALRKLAANQHTVEDIDQAEANLKKAIGIFYTIDNKFQIAACLHTLSTIYIDTADFEKYLECSEDALRMLKASGADGVVYARAYITTLVSRCLEMLNLRLYDRAGAMLDEMRHSAELERSGEYGWLNFRLTEGQYYTETGNYAKSNEILLGLLNTENELPLNREKAAVHSYLAENMTALGFYKEAQEQLDIAEGYHRKTVDIPFVCENLLVRALLNSKQGRADKAADCQREAQQLAASTKSDYQLWHFYERYASFFVRQGDYKKAYELELTAKKYQAANLRTNYDKRLHNISTRFELAEKEKQNKLLQKDIEMKKQELTMASDFLQQKAELLREMKGFMKSMRRENIQKNELMKALDKKIDSVMNVEHEQQLFLEKLENSSNEFIRKLRISFPTLTQSEAKVCSLLYNNFSSKEIASLLVTSIRTVENHRYNIRRKLNINSENTLQMMLARVEENQQL